MIRRINKGYYRESFENIDDDIEFKIDYPEFTQNICAKHGMYPDEGLSGAYSKWLSDNVYVAISDDFDNGEELGVEIGILDDNGDYLLETDDIQESVTLDDWSDASEVKDGIEFLLKWAKNKIKLLKHSRNRRVRQELEDVDINEII